MSALEQWDAYVAQAPDGGLLQSSAWAAFQEALGRQVAFLRITNKNESTNTSAHALVVEHKLPLGLSYVYSPRGPVVMEHGTWNMEHVLSEMAGVIRQKFPRAIFWRIEPPFSPSYKLQANSYKLVRASRDVQPATTLVIDLTKSEEELLAAMKQKTRYNIGVAERYGVTVSSSLSDEDCGRFLEILEQTARRDGFKLHPLNYYRVMLTGPFELFVAEHQGRMLAGAIVAFFGQWSYYLHGASSSEHRALMAPYALHWEIMRQAKSRGCTRYDLWGIDEHRWPGVTRFKTGFAPNTKPTTFAGTWDVVFRPALYRLYRSFS